MTDIDVLSIIAEHFCNDYITWRATSSTMWMTNPANDNRLLFSVDGDSVKIGMGRDYDEIKDIASLPLTSPTFFEELEEVMAR